MEEEDKIKKFCQFLKEDEKAENTIKNYEYAAVKFFSSFNEVTKQNMIAYKKQMIEEFSPSTAANRCAGMNRYCDFIGKPECKVKAVKTPKRLSAEDVPTEEEYYCFLEYLLKENNLRYYWLIQFIAKTGARVSEITRFERKHLETGKAEFWNKGKIRRILIPASLIRDSREYFDKFFAEHPEEKLLFPSRNGGQLRRESVRTTILSNGQKCGLRREILHPHAFRHLFAVQFLKHNDNIALLADLMGHESVDTTAIYLKLSIQEQRNQLNDAMDW